MSKEPNPKEIMIHYEGKDTKIGDLSKNEMCRLIAALLYQKAQLNAILNPQPVKEG